MERGFSLEEHRSTPVDGSMIDQADVVLYMDGGNKRRLEAFISENYSPQGAEYAWKNKCRLLASYGSLRRLRDPNYTSDPVELAKMFKEAELCTMKFLEAHSA
jgi:protein-tyrosine-phosphatase